MAFSLHSLLVAALAALATAQDPYPRGLQPMVRDYSEPDSPVSQFRLAFNGPGGMTVSWNSPGQISEPTVYYGTDPNNLNLSSSSGTSTTFDSAVSWDNHVHLSGLAPFTKYYYRVSGQDASSDPETEDFYFVTGREAGDRTPFTIAFFADMGIVVGNAFNKVIPPTFGSLYDSRDEYEFIWHAGDFAYADDWLWEELEAVLPLDLAGGANAYMNIFNAYFDQLANVTKNAAYMSGPGNHEADCIEPDFSLINDIIGLVGLNICPEGQRNFTAYLNHFSMPTEGQTPNFLQNMWYSWDYGMAHFVQINTETDFTDAPDQPGESGGLDSGPFGFSGQQLQWLEADLAAVDRTKTPWVIVGGHRPWYSASANCGPCQTAFEDILYQYNVDLAWFGHIHYYERDLPVYKGNADPNGLSNPRAPWNIVSGAAGNFEGFSSPNSNLPSYTVVINDQDYGWSKLIFHNSSYLEERYISSETGEVLDSAILYKDHGLDW